MSSAPHPLPPSGPRGGTAEVDPKTFKRRRKLRRRAAGAALLLGALAGTGAIAAIATPNNHVAVADPNDEALVQDGKKLYETSCISCHGKALEGVEGRGPSLVGVGNAAVYFQVNSGRMPATFNTAQIERKPAKFDESQTDAMGAYIQSIGGGPSVAYEYDDNGAIKRDEHGNRIIAQGSLRGDDVSTGGHLFRLNCASCHNFTGRGGALSSGKYAPPLTESNEQEIYTAMLTGPQNMPKFSNRQLTEEEKKDIIGYVKMATEVRDPGGYGLGGFGPVSEGMAMWAIGITAIVGAAMWVGSRN